MKQTITLAITACSLLVSMGCVSANKEMTVSSTGISNGIIAAKYGQFGDAANIAEKNPATDDAGNKVIMKVNALSFPLQIKNAPQDTKGFVVYLHDPDAAVHGFGDFTHWLAYTNTADLKENASRVPPVGMIQGKNGWGDTGYAGMGPPDKLGYTLVTGGPIFQGEHKHHTYVLEVFALNAEVTVTEGFTLEQMQTAIKDTVLAQTTMSAIYYTDKAAF